MIPAATRGIYVVANRRSEKLCRSLVLSIRKAGCHLPIALIPFGGEPVTDPTLLAEVQPFDLSAYGEGSTELIKLIGRAANGCPAGFLRRFAACFGPFEEFIYSDNDIVALCDWTELFELAAGADLLHADQEYLTEGRYNCRDLPEFRRVFGSDAIATALTAGHFLARKSARLLSGLEQGARWMIQHPGVMIPHDQALMQVALLLGNWTVTNLCKPPHGWLSSWAGDHPNTLSLIQAVQRGSRISHVHYSGSQPDLTSPVMDLLTHADSPRDRLRDYWKASTGELAGWKRLRHYARRLKSRCRKLRS